MENYNMTIAIVAALVLGALWIARKCILALLEGIFEVGCDILGGILDG